MASEAAALDALVSASRLRIDRSASAPSAPASWSCATLGGALAELSGSGAAPRLTLAFALVHQMQRRGEPAAWITRSESTFFPPDAAAGGVDLAAFPVVRLADRRQCLRAADQLVRSGAFGLVVVDLGECVDLPLAVQTRLAGQAIAHRTLVLCLTVKDERQPSLGSLVSVHVRAWRVRHADGRFACRVRALKDKRRGPGWSDEVWCRGPDGVC